MRPALFVPPAISWRCPFLGGLCRRHEMPPLQLRRGHWLQIFAAAPSHGAISRAPAGAAAPQSRILCGGEDCLSAALVLSNAKELSINNRPPGKADSSLARMTREILRFAQDKLGMTTERHLWGRAWAPMVLGPFAETKGSRRVGATPHILPPRSAGAKPRKTSPASCGAATPRASRSLSVILANARIQRLSFLLTKKRQKPWIPDRGLSSTFVIGDRG